MLPSPGAEVVPSKVKDEPGVARVAEGLNAAVGGLSTVTVCVIWSVWLLSLVIVSVTV